MHVRKEKFQMGKLVILAQQIAQGMGYLHHRNIVHKDLKTKNIFLENGKAIITDFGLVNVTRRLNAKQIGQQATTFSALTERYEIVQKSKLIQNAKYCCKGKKKSF